MRAADITPLGDSAVVVKLGEKPDRKTHGKVRMVTEYLSAHPFDGMIELIPAYTTVTVVYDPYRVWMAENGAVNSADQANAADAKGAAYPHDRVAAWIKERLAAIGEREPPEPKVVEIPVCYGGEFGPDLETVARISGMTADEVIAIHSGADYLVHMLGFAPGFAYLGGMDPRIAAPRKATPRLSIPPGSVGIAGEQTGIYPIETPGGWQLIGRSPVRLFRPEQDPPVLLEAGNLVRFRPIFREDFEQLYTQAREGMTR